MDKPVSLTMREYIVRTLAPKLLISEKVVDTVVAHQFSEANAAMYENDSIEISGFGKFIFNTKKAHKKLETMIGQRATFEKQMNNPELSEQKRHTALSKYTTIGVAIEHLKSKLHD
jgi:nucleoid DNA-binding protein